ncbi:phage coat protein [Bacillus sp. YC2]|nr:phage coat protein [Bacillus sp. YC2]
MDKTKSEAKLRRYLNDNLSEETKERYKVKIIKKDINVLKRQHEKYLESTKAHCISYLIV